MAIQVREYALLTCDASVTGSIDMGVISSQTFDWLVALQQEWGENVQLLSREGKAYLRLGSYVGYLQSPAGESIEILPKTQYEIVEEIEPLRLLLRRMLNASIGISPREASVATLKSTRQPLHEWILSEFLRHLIELVKRGLRFDYLQTEDDDSSFIRGQLDINRQLRQVPGKGVRFHVHYDEFSPQRMENRVLRTALDRVVKITKESQNWRIATMLVHQLADLKPISDPLTKMKSWGDGKYLAHYRAIKPWCQLILEKLNPDFQKGESKGISLLFRMEQLYENWVGHTLANQLRNGYHLSSQVKKHALLTHTPEGANAIFESWFMLRPDFFIEGETASVVLDAKWKLLDGSKANRSDKYNLSQSDLYQMYAYGQKYLAGKGQMMLIYPQHSLFSKPLPPFHFDSALSLWCVPFNIESAMLAGEAWQPFFPALTGDTLNCIAVR